MQPDRVEYNARLKELGVVHREVRDRNFPAMTCAEVSLTLVEVRAKKQIALRAALSDVIRLRSIRWGRDVG